MPKIASSMSCNLCSLFLYDCTRQMQINVLKVDMEIVVDVLGLFGFHAIVLCTS